MELMPSNKTENLTETEQNEQQNVDFTPISIGKSGQLSEETLIIKLDNFFAIFGAIVITLFFTLLAVCSSFDIYFKIILFLFGVISSLILLYIISNKIILIKDSFNKKILIKVVNYLCLCRMKLSFDLENIHFYVNSELHEPEEGENYRTNRLFIINDYKNFVGIDLNESNIKKEPVKCIYNFRNPHLGKDSYKKFEEKLNDFVGSSRNYKNPLLFDINTYLEEGKKIKSYFSKIKFMKFSEHFFTYYLKRYQYSISHLSTLDNCFLFFFLYFFGLLQIFALFTVLLFFIENKYYFGILIAITAVIIINLIIYFLYKCCKLCNENILRIDFINSKDFDRIFIGVVKYTQKKYVNTFEFQKNNIDKFLYEREGNSNTNFNLKVVLKNNEIQQICSLKKQTEDELEGLIYFLNGTFITHTKDSSNSYEQI